MERTKSNRLAVRCTVRGCHEALTVESDGGWVCARGHRFDRARGGYVNLLQPQDRRSKFPGDSPETVAARGRIAEADCEAALRAAIVSWLELPRGPSSVVLEIGCGTGELLARAAEEHGFEGYGLDLSARALREGARRDRDVRWFAANADRGLPFADSGVDLALTVKAPKPFDELRRVLRPDGRLLVAVPAPDDLTELRSEVSGSALARDPAELARARAEAAGLQLAARWSVRTVRELEASTCRDLLLTGYRGARHSESRRLADESASRTVTLATDLLEFVPATLP